VEARAYRVREPRRRRRPLHVVTIYEGSMRALRSTVLLLIAVSAFAACKRHGGYMTPAPVPQAFPQ